ncbi:MAG: LD-carboxypeptidase [Flavobacteriales bacterium]|nr:LD-carboxypeptidase [Flavobacteriales bacterium]
MIIPEKLTKGDVVLIIAPARKVELKQLEAAEKLLNDWELKVERSPNLMQKSGIFAGTDALRKSDLQWALDHPQAKAIWCFRGGYGTVRLIENLSPIGFLNKPKWIIGFSDVTVLHSFSNIILNTASIHATMPINVIENTPDSLKSLKEVLFSVAINHSWIFNKNNRIGETEAEIVGGNLSVLTSMLGTNYQPDFEGKILFIEEIDEYLYNIDRMCWQLKFAGVFNHIKGLVIGHFSKVKDNKIPFGMTIEDIILEKVKEFDFPIAFDFSAGHENENQSLLFGVKTKFFVQNDKSILK